jgi:LemA protein
VSDAERPHGTSFKVLKRRDFAVFWSAAFVSNTGSWTPEQQSELYRLDFKALVKGDAAASAKLNLVDPAVHPLQRVAAMYDDLEAWHRSAGRREAALNARMERLETLRAACLQTDMARAHAKAHPGAPGAITSLRLADDILAEARARLPVQAIGGVDMSALNAELGAADTALAFARRQFNETVLAYNHAIRQIPTRLIAAIFGFAPAGTL